MTVTIAPPDGCAAEIVLDTNVLLDWLVFRHPGLDDLGTLIRQAGLRWVQTDHMRRELGHVLTRPLLAHWSADREQILARVAEQAELVEAPEPIAPPARLRCRDRDDQCFIDLALTRRSRWLLSRDRALLKLARRAAPFGVAVLTPEAWLGSRDQAAAQMSVSTAACTTG